jgi:intracellular septation protein
MKLFFDFLPGLLFLGALLLFDIYTATAVVMAAMTVQVAALLALRKKVSGIQWFTLGIILLFGGATLLLRDPTFIKWKPTVINWMFAVLLLAGPAVLGKNFLRLMLQEHMTAPERVWAQLNVAWAVVFILIGALNLVVAYHFSERIWGFFKVFGITGILLVFSVAQAVYLSRFMPEQEAPQAPKT